MSGSPGVPGSVIGESAPMGETGPKPRLMTESPTDARLIPETLEFIPRSHVGPSCSQTSSAVLIPKLVGDQPYTALSAGAVGAAEMLGGKAGALNGWGWWETEIPPGSGKWMSADKAFRSGAQVREKQR